MFKESMMKQNMPKCALRRMRKKLGIFLNDPKSVLAWKLSVAYSSWSPQIQKQKNQLAQRVRVGKAPNAQKKQFQMVPESEKILAKSILLKSQPMFSKPVLGNHEESCPQGLKSLHPFYKKPFGHESSLTASTAACLCEEYHILDLEEEEVGYMEDMQTIFSEEIEGSEAGQSCGDVFEFSESTISLVDLQ